MTLQRFLERLIWLCILPLLCLGVVLSFLHLTTLEDRRRMLAESMLDSAAHLIDETIDRRLNGLMLLARSLEAQAFDASGTLNRAMAHQIGQDFLAIYGDHLLVANRQRQMLLNTRVDLHAPLPPMPQIQGHSATDVALYSLVPAVGDAFIGPIIKRELVAIAVPMRSPRGEPMAAYTTVETSRLQARLQTLSLPARWSLRLFDSRGILLAKVGDEPPMTEDAPDNPGAERYRVALRHAPWTLELSAPAAHALDSRMAQASLLLLTLGATVAAAYMGARLASRRLTRSMAPLTEPVPDPPPQADIEEVRKVREAARQSLRERQQAQEAERRRIGLEIHDDLQQRLALLRQELSRQAAPTPANGAPGAAPEPARSAAASPGLNMSLNLVDEALEATRRVVHNLRPPALDAFGLPEALRWLADEHRRSSKAGVEVDLHILSEVRGSALDPEVATALYRIAQEALNNVHKHARAQSVQITLDARSVQEALLEVSDDGVGLSDRRGRPKVGNGLRGMHGRAWSLGGRLEINSFPGQGTALVVRIPLPPLPGRPPTAEPPSEPPSTTPSASPPKTPSIGF